MKRHKVEVIRVNLSNSFMVRTKCAVCGEEPTIYYYNAKPYLWNEPKSQKRLFDAIKHWYKRMCMDWYLESNPSYFHSGADFSHPVDYKGFNPKLHYTRGINPDANIVEFITCWSGCTIWAFVDKANKNRPEFVNRKSRYSHPHKFFH